VTVYALLVGIDDYAGTPLRGSVEDIEQVREFLATRVPGGAVENVLCDDEATRAAITGGIRDHLGRAGPDDVALFWFCGHGGEEPVPEGYWQIEPSGYLQSLVCADSRLLGPDRMRVPDLVDKELGVLLDQVAARGPHVVVVLDSCHSGGATRDPDADPEGTVRGIGRAPDRLPVSSFVPEWTRGSRDIDAGKRGHSHILLAACRPYERTWEHPIGDRVRGVFSHALLHALQTLGADATYRDLVSVARCAVQNLVSEQSPMLMPAQIGLADQPFLGGQIRRPAAFHLVHGRSGWEIDAGRCHGIPEPTPDDPLQFAVTDRTDGIGLLHVVEVRPASSLVEPMEWIPNPGRAYPVVVASVPLPKAAVTVGGLPGDDPTAADMVRTAVGCAGPGGGPSLDVRVIQGNEPAHGLRLRVATSTVGGRRVFQILRGDGKPATSDIDGHTVEGARVVARLEHIARWTHIKQLENPASGLIGAVRVEVVEACAGERLAPRDRPGILPDGRGEIRLAYRRVGGQWVPPRAFIRLRNTSPRRLWCVLLDLNDRYGAHASLFPGDFVGSATVGAALEGRPIEVRLPPQRPREPGASVWDWLKLIVAEEPVSALAFGLPSLDEPATRGTGPIRIRGFVDRLGLRATNRGMAGVTESGIGGDWTTAIVPLVCEVPGV